MLLGSNLLADLQCTEVRIHSPMKLAHVSHRSLQTSRLSLLGDTLGWERRDLALGIVMSAYQCFPMVVTSVHLRMYLGEHIHHSHGSGYGVHINGFCMHPRPLCQHSNFDFWDVVYLIDEQYLKWLIQKFRGEKIKRGTFHQANYTFPRIM